MFASFFSLKDVVSLIIWCYGYLSMSFGTIKLNRKKPTCLLQTKKLNVKHATKLSVFNRVLSRKREEAAESNSLYDERRSFE